MIYFINAKINIGLQIVSRRPDGYHNLQSIFYPVGLLAGTPENPESFCDLLEVTPFGSVSGESEIIYSGRRIDCPPEKNLVHRAVKLYRERRAFHSSLTIRLEKHLPDGAGMGGGSADAAFTLLAMANCESTANKNNPRYTPPSRDALIKMAQELGADCPFFIYNKPAFVEGIGERIYESDLSLKDYWLVVVKPDIYISTAEAFARITPHAPDFNLRNLSQLPISEWKHCVFNDFETSIFVQYPDLQGVKESFYDLGAEYASLTGSGSCIYGIFNSYQSASDCKAFIQKMPTMQAAWLLKLM